MDGSAMDGGAAEPVAEATVRDDAATTIQTDRQTDRNKERERELTFRLSDAVPN